MAPVSGMFPCSLTCCGWKDEGVCSCGVVCTYTDTTAEKMFILISQTLPSIHPLPPPPHGSSCSGLARAFLSLHGHSANWFRWKTNFFFKWSYFLGQQFLRHFQPAASWMWVPAQSKGQPWGEKWKASVGRNESGLLAAIISVMLAEQQAAPQERNALSGRWDR